MTDLSPEEQLRTYIDIKLKDPQFLQRLYKEMRLTKSKEQIENMDSDEMYAFIVKNNLLENLIKEGADPQQMHAGDFVAEETIPLDDINLKVTVVEGKGFTEYLDRENPKKKLRVGISFLKNRAMTRTVNAVYHPIFDQTFLMSFGSMLQANQTTFDYLLRLKSPLSVVLVEEDLDTKNRKLLAEKNVEWRFVMVHKSLSMNLELVNAIPAKGPFGILKISFQMVTKSGEKIKLSEAALDGQLDKESKATSLKAANFFDFSQAWYSEYKSLSPEFAKRAVKIYVEHSTGAAYENAPRKPIFSYLSKLRLRGIDSPEQAGRFVSLIPFKKPDDPSNVLRTWRYFHSFLAEGRGEVQDHAALLCSLLLGFGLDAYLLVGSCTDGAHCWVLVRTMEKVISFHLRKDQTLWPNSLFGKV